MHDATHQEGHAKRLHQMNVVKRFLQSNKPLMLAVGEKGSGKSGLLTDIVLQMRVSRHIIRLQGHPKLRPAQLAEELSKHWAIQRLNQHQRLEYQIDDMLEALANHHQSCILVVDDAHLFSLSMLAALSHLATQQEGKDVCLHIILSGRPALSEKMNNLQTKDIPQITIGALSREDAFRKIKSILDRAGLSLPHTTANAVLTRIYQRSGGMPETLENMVDKLIAQRNSVETPEQHNKPIASNAQNSDAKILPLIERQFIKLMGLVGLVTIGIMIWHHSFQSTSEDYVLQVMSSASKTTLVQFAQQHHLNKTASIMQEKQQGLTRYVMTFGHFHSTRDAKNALHHLPKNLQTHQLRIRSAKNLHAIT